MAGDTSGTWLDTLVALIDARWQPDFSATIRGATPEALAELEVALGCPLLAEHRAFLARLPPSAPRVPQSAHKAPHPSPNFKRACSKPCSI